jgi:hypothetical protein
MPSTKTLFLLASLFANRYFQNESSRLLIKLICQGGRPVARSVHSVWAAGWRIDQEHRVISRNWNCLKAGGENAAAEVSAEWEW